MPSSRQTESAQKLFSRGTRGRERGGEDEIEEREKKAQELEGNEALSEGGAHRRM